jgi:hypothetical protein
MSGAEWLVSADPREMFDFIAGNTSERKLRLFACACCRQVWPEMEKDITFQKAIELAEQFADGLVSQATMLAASEAADEASQLAFDRNDAIGCCAGGAALFAAAENIREEAGSVIVNVLYTLPETDSHGQSQLRTRLATLLRDAVRIPSTSVGSLAKWLTWNDGCVNKIAQAIYETPGLPVGVLDNGRIGVLADALEDAGCDDADILAHCRGDGPHVRGCWVVDLLLGKQ